MPSWPWSLFVQGANNNVLMHRWIFDLWHISLGAHNILCYLHLYQLSTNYIFLHVENVVNNTQYLLPHKNVSYFFRSVSDFPSWSFLWVCIVSVFILAPPPSNQKAKYSKMLICMNLRNLTFPWTGNLSWVFPCLKLSLFLDVNNWLLTFSHSSI